MPPTDIYHQPPAGTKPAGEAEPGQGIPHLPCPNSYLYDNFLLMPYFLKNTRRIFPSSSLPPYRLLLTLHVTLVSQPDYTDRFELFIHGFEVVNAYSELNDPHEQGTRFLDQWDVSTVLGQSTNICPRRFEDIPMHMKS